MEKLTITITGIDRDEIGSAAKLIEALCDLTKTVCCDDGLFYLDNDYIDLGDPDIEASWVWE